MATEIPAPTIKAADVVERHCPHCQATTAQVAAEGSTCLQCIADGGNCCSLSQFNRWKETT